MSVSERGHDPCRLILEVYDDHQPLGGSHSALEIALSLGPALRFAMIRQLQHLQDGRQMWLQLGMAARRIQDVQEPGVLKQDDASAVRRPRLAQDRSFRRAG